MSNVAIVGKPNAGKSLLFNKLTGLKQKVSNFPGITVEVKVGKIKDISIFDFPGIYTMDPLTKDEVIAVQKFVSAMKDNNLQSILCVLDATKLGASLRLGLEVQYLASQQKVPVIFALNMMDEIENNNLKINIEGLAQELNAPVVAISAKTGKGLNDLLKKMDSINLESQSNLTTTFYERSKNLAQEFGPQSDVLFLKQTRLDKILLSPVFGILAFFAIMLTLFQAIFTWAAPFMDAVEWSIGSLGELVSSPFSDGIFKDFLVDAIFGGFGSFLVFVPQIFFLTLIVGFLEDSGYLARAAMICHKPLKFFGLSGKSFIPMLTGHACAIPAIFATRTIESPRRRFLTTMIVPLMGCSARLPVYALLIAAFIPPITFAGGIIGLQGITFFAIYALGIVTALIISFFISKSSFKKTEDSPFILELPPYRLPSLKPLISRSLQNSWHFITKAGGIIFTVSVVVWVLGYFPKGPGHLDESYLAYLGRLIEPALQPMQLDWKYGVAILTSFLAREVFVGTLGTLFGIEGADEDVTGLIETVQKSDLSMASGLALLVFFAIALQCVSTLAVMKKELGEYKTPIYIFIFYSLLAYLMALTTYNIFA